MKYVARKIAHMKRIGVIEAKHSGFGMNGGACPDWLLDFQKAEIERLANKFHRNKK